MPQIEITRNVRIALIVLRVYLVTMLVLIVIGFVRRATHKEAPPSTGANAATASGPATAAALTTEPASSPASQPASAPAPAGADAPR